MDFERSLTFSHSIKCCNAEEKVVGGCVVVSSQRFVFRPTPVWGAVLLDESSIGRGPDDPAGGNRHSLELIETRI